MYRNYFLPNFDELNFFCSPHSVGKYTSPDEHDVQRESGVKDFSLHFVMNGKGYVEMNDAVYTLKRGDAFLHVPFQRMRYYTSDDDSWEIYWIQFNGSKLAEFLLERGFYDPTIWFVKDAELLEQSFLDLMEEIEENGFSRPGKISTLTYSILTEFTLAATPFSDRKKNDHVERVLNLLPQMQASSHLPFMMKEWADKAELTPNYFCSLFKKVTRTTPLAYITKCRILRSKQMLLSHPARPIHQVAISSGYPTASYFNKVFMEMEGITPSDFRKKYGYEGGAS